MTLHAFVSKMEFNHDYHIMQYCCNHLANWFGVLATWSSSQYLATSSFVQNRVQSEHRYVNRRTSLCLASLEFSFFPFPWSLENRSKYQRKRHHS